VEQPSPRFLVFGRLAREYQLFPDGYARLDAPGGNVLYAAAGLAVWEPDPPPAIVARVGNDYPSEWLETFAAGGIDTRGVRCLTEPVDLRLFHSYTDLTTRAGDDPVAHFARHGMAFPKELLGYKPPSSAAVDSRTRLQPSSLRQGDVPYEFLEASAAHLCPLDYLTHSVLPAMLRQAEFTAITLDPSPGYMTPAFWEHIPALLTGLTAFLPSEEEARTLFGGRTTDLWQMAEALASYGTEIIVIKRGSNGQILYDSATRVRYEIPPYPARLVNPTGAGDAFCGGFLAGYRRTYDPLEAALHGNISASLAVEGHSPLYAIDALKGLALARIEALRQTVRKV
jgi:sugar/nucleoside kinase (ribokinase family)